MTARIMNGLKFPGTGRGANSCPELSLYIDAERELQPAEGRVSQWELCVFVFRLRGRKKELPESCFIEKTGAPFRRYPFLSSSEAGGRDGGLTGLHALGDRERGRAGQAVSECSRSCGRRKKGLILGLWLRRTRAI